MSEELVHPEMQWVLGSVDHRPETRAETSLVAEARRLAAELSAAQGVLGQVTALAKFWNENEEPAGETLKDVLAGDAYFSLPGEGS